MKRVTKLLPDMQTMPYMPPELLAQSQLTPKADVYSFGIVMWELLSGQVCLSHTALLRACSAFSPHLEPSLASPLLTLDSGQN